MPIGTKSGKNTHTYRYKVKEKTHIPTGTKERTSILTGTKSGKNTYTYRHKIRKEQTYLSGKKDI